MTQTDKFNEKIIEGKLKKWKGAGKQYYTFEAANIIPKKYYIDMEMQTFELVYKLPDGEETSDTRKIEFIDDRLACFKEAREEALAEEEEEKPDEFTELPENTEIPEQKFTPEIINKITTKGNFSIIHEKPKPQIKTTAHTTMETETDELTVKELRSKLFSTIKNLLDKKISPEEAKSIAMVGQTIINSVKLEMEYKMLDKKDREVKFLD